MEVIRNPKGGKAHRPYVVEAEHPYGEDVLETVCGIRGAARAAMTERVPLERTAEEDRCRKCWR